MVHLINLRTRTGTSFRFIEINDGTDPLDPEDYPKSNSAPVSISLNPRKILENSPFYTVVGNFEVIDPDESDSHTFSLLKEADYLSFWIDGRVLKIRDRFDYERRSTYTIRVKALDIGGLSVEKSFEITILDDINEDGDGDGLSQKTENELGIDDGNPDTDGDGAGDGYEIQHRVILWIQRINR